MNRLLASAFLFLYLPLTAFAQVAPAGHVFVRVPRVCGLNAVMLQVRGDNVNMENFEVLYGNGTTERIETRGYFQAGSSTVWKQLPGGLRCIDGFWVAAQAEHPFSNPTVWLYGSQLLGNQNRTVELGAGSLRQFGF